MAEKSERLLNLYIMLLAQTRFVAKQDIRRAHYGEYPDNARGLEAFEKAFERDKEDLRELGVDLVQGYHVGRPIGVEAAIAALPRVPA